MHYMHSQSLHNTVFVRYLYSANIADIDNYTPLTIALCLDYYEYDIALLLLQNEKVDINIKTEPDKKSAFDFIYDIKKYNNHQAMVLEDALKTRMNNQQ